MVMASLAFSLLTKFISKRKRNKFIRQPDSSWKADVPLIVVGNIVVGGTGKTPLVIWLLNYLKRMDISHIVSRGYGGSSTKKSYYY